MDEEIYDIIANDFSHKYGNNEVDKAAIYELIISKLRKEKAKWKGISSLTTFLKTIAYNEITKYRAINKAWTDTEVILPITDLMFIDNTDTYSKEQGKHLLQELKDNVSPLEYEVICMTFGLDEYDTYTRKEIEDLLFLTGSEQRTLVKNAFDRLKSNKVINELYKSL